VAAHARRPAAVIVAMTTRAEALGQVALATRPHRRAHRAHPRQHPLALASTDLAQPDRLSPARWAAAERNLPPDLATAGVAADHEAALAAAIASGRPCSASSGARGLGMAGPVTPVLRHGANAADGLPRHTACCEHPPD